MLCMAFMQDAAGDALFELEAAQAAVCDVGLGAEAESRVAEEQ